MPTHCFHTYVMALTNPIKILETCRVCLDNGSPELPAEAMSLPLTFFDTIWFKFHPVERLYFFNLNDSDPTFFKSAILEKLKQSLSLALLHFLPLAAKLIWPPNADVPLIKYTHTDAVSLTLAESNADFSVVSDFQPKRAVDSHSYVPKLSVSESEASIIALQITLFPNKGFCVGYSAHHAVVDGKSLIMFMKAWAYICKHLEQGNHQNLPPELAPFFDRTLLAQDPCGFTSKFLDVWLRDKSSRSLKLALASTPQPDLVRATFKLSREDIKKLRQRVLTELKDDTNQEQLHLSTFVLTYAYTMVCILKAKGVESNTLLRFTVTGDCRGSVETPLPANYFGNCVSSVSDVRDTAITYVEENGVANAAKKLGGLVKQLQTGKLEAQLERILDFFRKIFNPDERHLAEEFIGVAGSPRFEVYGVDFGWGRPKSVEIISVDGTRAISLNESGDGNGVEIGLALKEHQMNTFQSLFTCGLQPL